MYVVRYTNDRGAARNSFFGFNLGDGQDFILPADRCVWRQVSVDGGYQIQAVSVIVGGDSVANSDVRLDAAAGDILTLGFLGKTGRFVPITVPYRRNA